MEIIMIYWIEVAALTAANSGYRKGVKLDEI